MPTQRDIAAQWLAALAPPRRDQLLALEPDDVMPRRLALDLATIGVAVVPAYFDGLLGASVKAEYRLPDVLVDALDEWRHEHPRETPGDQRAARRVERGGGRLVELWEGALRPGEDPRGR